MYNFLSAAGNSKYVNFAAIIKSDGDQYHQIRGTSSSQTQ